MKRKRAGRGVARWKAGAGRQWSCSANELFCAYQLAFCGCKDADFLHGCSWSVRDGGWVSVMPGSSGDQPASNRTTDSQHEEHNELI